ncbi:MAG: maleylpyruvate isomerase family mycothiol-dependent enzyme [Chloroflexi bacterium]|nr:maleylpyruvate isomerase family mycothiol-dependent enzyme [Chloroflexota bacterium]MCI0802176.1 maleylpyruvate isomerase family mycothiol-dependent enzyme [Chloroflexota bacterium]MCI0811978.1 maleylpyruvate isomerase family mycothiol-dependent enzyme [Chloroflexota bacterium]MCI0830248.1 maleylpyruvate isomerase family mycothiol-dependent enzyme [Chloroflexota bacterium]MCI0849203.1 maleylpyruvate isomerase family mycothiol-dependent enzyme [Chloroflexota bacterium]
MSNQQVVDLMEHVWESIGSLCSPLTEAQWKTATDCPGWSVQDQVSHLVGAESGILGNPRPDHTPQETAHVKNDVGQSNEVVVDFRRSWPGEKVLEEFRELTGQRLIFLRGLTDEEFAAETQTPIGPGTVTEFVRIRIFDAWVHEQDIRRALSIPGELEGPVAAHSVGRVARAMPFVVARKAQAPDGVTVVFEITGPAGCVVPVAIEGRRGSELDSEPPSPTVRITTDVETFACLGCGRWDPAEALRSGKITVAGDTALGESIVNQMNIMI